MRQTFESIVARRQARWWGAALGLLLTVTDVATMVALGVRFQLDSWNATPVVFAFFGTSVVTLGFLVGALLEGRHRERAAAAALDGTRARLAQSEKLAALGQLAAAIAHEVRNPLAVVRSAAQGLTETLPADDAPSHRSCSFIIAEVDRLGSVVSSLLAFARPLQLRPRPVAVSDLVDRALLLAGGELAGKHVQVRCATPAGLPTLQADADLVCQALITLLANAAEAVPEAGEVSIEAQAADGTVELAVADSGPGVPPELRARIFEPFFTTRPRGTGLGLAVARQIVEAHGGKLDVGERMGGGARFTLRLPAVAAA